LLAMTTWNVNVAPDAALFEPRIDSTERSADAFDVATMPVVAVLELFEVSGSGVAAVIVAVLLTMPDGAEGDVFTEMVMLVSASSSNAGAVQLTVPLAPTLGVVQVNSDDDTWMAAKLVPDGSVSVTVTFCAFEGPLLNTKIE